MPAEPTSRSPPRVEHAEQGRTGYSSFNLSQTHPQPLADSGRRALELVASGQVRLDITAEYDLADLATAVQRIADRATAGKSVPRITKV
jgi:NADPH2:quinone reductase